MSRKSEDITNLILKLAGEKTPCELYLEKAEYWRNKVSGLRGISLYVVRDRYIIGFRATSPGRHIRIFANLRYSIEENFELAKRYCGLEE